MSVEDSSPREQELIRAASSGHKDAFGDLYRMYAPRIFSIASGLLLDRDEALDVTQETFIRAWRALPRFHQGSPLFPWLYTIARNRCMSRLARRSRDRECVEFDDRVGGETDHSTRTVEIRRDLARALAELKPEHREIILLRHFQDLSYEEIAGSLGCPVGTVMSRLHHARKALAAGMAPWKED
ncbi:MAG: sigma-70 family RNA polymerase sigma factor [Candidatus Eisenbacteria bacterium]|jgi:RNA polymerase sigma-70 factor (ECF subfamily)|nr:sigma-70 family RNA polymerase sigma factor [Candidatus Eisenbacteria bacterium]